LRWINVGAGELLQIVIMGRFIKNQSTLTAPSEQRPDSAGTVAATARQLALATVPAAWPTGVSQLAQAVDACQRSDPGQVGTDWLLRAAGARAYLTT
jgi:hypothetical protein